MAGQWPQESLAREPCKFPWRRPLIVCILLFKATWVTQYFLAFYACCFAVRIGWLFPWYGASVFLIFLMFAFSQWKVAFCPCLLPRSGLVAMAHPLLWLTISLLDISSASFLTSHPWDTCASSAFHTLIHTCSLSPLLLKGSSSDVSGGPRMSLAWAPQPEAVFCTSWCIWPQACVFLKVISKEAEDIMVQLTFYGHWRQTQEFQAVLSLWYW